MSAVMYFMNALGITDVVSTMVVALGVILILTIIVRRS